jgi:hypothetical protein
MAAHELLVASIGGRFSAVSFQLSAFCDRLSASERRSKGNCRTVDGLSTIEGSRPLTAEG